MAFVLDSSVALRLLGRLGVGIDRAPVEAEIFRLARRHQLTAYDAAYVELALRDRLPLATLDRALARAARIEGVDLIGTPA